LQLKKYRNKAQSFLVEGTKSVLELLQSNFEVTHLIGTASFLESNEAAWSKLAIQPQVVDSEQLSKISALQTNQEVLAVVRYLPEEPLPVDPEKFYLALDRINDPGNLGTIIRTADWYGIDQIFCSTDSVDFYNPKVIQATMGSFLRVRVRHLDLLEFLEEHHVYGAALDGKNIHQVKFDAGGMVLVGSESHGISAHLTSIVDEWISIPRYGQAESLNAALATAVICDNLRRSF